ncbi:putative alpha-galactosidase [Actinoplanes missouriensis 431]|uniref:Alpha-galactosidase n=1 Tax=Actinoplanes missouriensis (strain ATCC 14538 / DSM 43046 / CBS 188.64 / JCM 3121 / NBRC 102363 / NCIMB 12654 / NRRL B-3342 / UNCC 431) TaxID=512565 RepID=I0H5C3_ACTM4|nr:alpha-galactosidase [Actinoplanes missouriensis]BAL88210.1 putative alpha-galactosidase [Actinoplanes missouriensis 431]
MPDLRYVPEQRLWLLHTPSTSYAVALDDDDNVRHLHWGARLTTPAIREPAAGSSFDTAGGPRELDAEGGARFGPAGLQVRFADGSRGVEWRYAGHDIDAGHLRIHLDDRHHPLRVTLHYRVYDDTDVIERWTTVTNSGEPITVQRCDSASWTLPQRPGYRMSHLVGGWNSEFRLRRTDVPVAETVFTSRRGMTSHQANPWLALDDGATGEEHGEVWSTALAWSGSWRITLHRDPAGHVAWTGGPGHEGLTWTLGTGETLETPVYAGLYTGGGFGAASRAWHAYTRRHVVPHPAEVRPVLYNSWEATGFDVDEAGQTALAARAARLGVELFVVDDGWFGERVSDHAGLGDWTPNPDRFPQGLRPLADEVHRLGMLFGLWVEPEMVNPDSDLYRAHPDWVLHTAHRGRTEMRNQLVLNLARPDTAAWTHAWLDRLVTDNDIDFLKWDANRAFTEAGWPGHADPDRLWLDHTRAVYQIMDRLRADHPGLRIEACSGGGGRADLGILARTDQVWTSDNTDPVDRIGIQHGFSQLFPAQVMGAWVTDSPNVATARRTPLRFRFHVAMAGALGIGGDLTTWSEDELKEAAELIEVYKRIRPAVQHGAAHRLTGDGTLSAVGYAHEDQFVLLAWCPSRPFGHDPAPLRLTGIDPAAEYRDTDTGAVHSGAVLRQSGLDLDFPQGDHASVLVHLVRVDRKG